jgi:CRISPR-associated endonuclease Csn1
MSYKDEQGNLRIGKDGKPEKGLTKQTKGDSWAIRKSLHKDTVSGKVELQRIKEAPVALNSAIDNWKSIANKRIRPLVKEQFRIFEDDLSKVKAYFKKHPIIIDGIVVDKVLMYEAIEATAVRTELTEDFTRKQLESITDTAITIILENHIKNYVEQKGDKTVERFDLAFNPDGLDELNRNMVKLNNGKPHQPIKKVRIYEEGGKFSVGVSGNKSSKYVEAAKGTNLFFAIYWNEKKGKREYDTIPLNEVVEHQKLVAHLPVFERTLVPIDSKNGKFLFSLSPNDLVYVPIDEELSQMPENLKSLSKEQAKRVYVMEKASGSECYFMSHNIASLIKSYDAKSKFGEFGSQNKFEKDTNGFVIKDRCWKLEVDKLGNITKVIR